MSQQRMIQSVGDIAQEIEDIEEAFDRFSEAVDGPCIQDYSSDEEAYIALARTATRLRDTAMTLLNRLPSPSAEPPKP